MESGLQVEFAVLLQPASSHSHAFVGWRLLGSTSTEPLSLAAVGFPQC